jgi:hypothetical protein
VRVASVLADIRPSTLTPSPNGRALRRRQWRSLQTSQRQRGCLVNSAGEIGRIDILVNNAANNPKMQKDLRSSSP